MQPLISIITTTYNAQNLIEKTINSIRYQTYQNIEYIIIDGNSTDHTIDIIKQNLDIITSYLSEPDKGIYDAMNKGLDKATGDFVIFMGAGDIFYSNLTLENVSKKINDYNTIYYGDVLLGKTRKKHWGKFNKLKICITNICHQSIFYPKYVYNSHQYNTKYKVYADYYLNLHLFNRFKFTYIEEIITRYDLEGYSSYTKDINFEKEENTIIISEYGYTIFIISQLYRLLLKLKKWLRTI